MIFDDSTLQQASALAMHTFEQTRHRSVSDQKHALFVACRNLATTMYAKSGTLPAQNKYAFHMVMIAALSELDRLNGARQLPPVEIIDLMTHFLFAQQNEATNAPIVCHGEQCIQFALWYAHLGKKVFLSAQSAYIPHLVDFLKGTIIPIEKKQGLLENALHVAIFNTGANDSAEPFLRNYVKGKNQGAVVLTNWSFLSTNAPRTLQVKQQLIKNGHLLSVTQLPEGLMPRALPALLQLGPQTIHMPKVRLVNARQWNSTGSNGTLKMNAVHPILVQAGIPIDTALPEGVHLPPAEAISPETLIARQCDLRLHCAAPKAMHQLQRRTDSLGNCASLVRGQMLTKCKSADTAQVFREVTLGDIDELGFITYASRLVDNAAPLPRARKLALLQPGDILIACKGSLQSLGKVGLVTKADSNWLPNQTFYLIRSEAVDPLWLFYYLRSAQAQAYFNVRSSGTSVPQIQIGDLVSMGIPLPVDSDVQNIHTLHTSIIKFSQKITKYHEQIKQQSEAFATEMWQD